MLIIDSGSTKADWLYTSQNIAFTSAGINATHLNEEAISAILKSEVISKVPVNEIKKIFFFGSGCSGMKAETRIKKAFKDIFMSAEIFAGSDMLGAVYATCGKDPGFVGILGTGSNCVFFNGKEIEENNYGLGYILADEGAGTYLGKKIITSYLYGSLPKEIQKDFESNYSLTRSTVLENVYGNNKANVWLASFSEFYSTHSKHPWIQSAVKDGFKEFLNLYVMNNELHNKYPVHFIGSIAFHFKDMLIEVLQELKLKSGKIIKKPIDEIVSFLKNNNQSL